MAVRRYAVDRRMVVFRRNVPAVAARRNPRVRSEILQNGNLQNVDVQNEAAHLACPHRQHSARDDQTLVVVSGPRCALRILDNDIARTESFVKLLLFSPGLADIREHWP